jgi:hypothetical protein
VRKRGIVIARQKHPDAGEWLKRLKGPSDCPIRNLIAVKSVAGDKDRFDRAVAGQFGDGLDCPDALKAQFGSGVAGNIAEGLANLPVCGVKKAKRHCDNSPQTRDTPEIRSIFGRTNSTAMFCPGRPLSANIVNITAGFRARDSLESGLDYERCDPA